VFGGVILRFVIFSTPVVDNHRVLHGRSSFNGKRRMCGAYIGIDEYQSKLKVLTERFANNSEEEVGRSVWSRYL
jgi:trimethyllysine dioxygenase